MKRSQQRWGSLVAATIGLVTLAGCGGGSAVAPGTGDSFPSGATTSSAAATESSFETSMQFGSDGVSQGTVIVNMKSQAANALDLLSQQFQVRRALAPIRSAVLAVPAGLTAQQFVQQLRQDSRFSSVELNRRVTLDPISQVAEPAIQDVTPLSNDPLFARQWNMARINTPQAWSIQAGDPRTIIALTDTGVDLEHPDLKDKLLPGHNSLDASQPVQDDVGHGTHTAGIAAAATNNGIGVAGVGNRCMILPVKVLAKNGGSLDSIADGVVWAADHGAKVISMSLGVYQRSDVIERALDYAMAADVVITASAGNNNVQNDPVSAPHIPSTHAGVIEVAATDQNDKKATFSNFGKTVSIAAPGVSIISTIPVSQGSYGAMSGTSMAAPHAAGLVGLIRSQHPDWHRDQIKKWLESTANKLGNTGFNPQIGNGRIDAEASLR